MTPRAQIDCAKLNDNVKRVAGSITAGYDCARLGTLACNEATALRMTRAAGFGRFRKLDYPESLNNYYEVRK